MSIMSAAQKAAHAASYSKIPKTVTNDNFISTILSEYSRISKATIVVEEETVSHESGKGYKFERPDFSSIHDYRSNNGIHFEGLALAAGELFDYIEEVMSQTADITVDYLKERTPVDTGRARNGWEKSSESIVNPVPYVKYLNDGTAYIRPHAMIESTINDSQRILDLAQSRVQPK